MDTTHTRTKFVRAAVLAGTAATARRSRQMLIVLALALGAILLTLSAPVSMPRRTTVRAATTRARSRCRFTPARTQWSSYLADHQDDHIDMDPAIRLNVVVNFYDNVNLLLNKKWIKDRRAKT